MLLIFTIHFPISLEISIVFENVNVFDPFVVGSTLYDRNAASIYLQLCPFGSLKRMKAAKVKVNWKSGMSFGDLDLSDYFRFVYIHINVSFLLLCVVWYMMPRYVNMYT